MSVCNVAFQTRSWRAVSHIIPFRHAGGFIWSAAEQGSACYFAAQGAPYENRIYKEGRNILIWV
jgi:hypothetical protein